MVEFLLKLLLLLLLLLKCLFLSINGIFDCLYAFCLLPLSFNYTLLSCTNKLIVDEIWLVVQSDEPLPHAAPNRDFV